MLHGKAGSGAARTDPKLVVDRLDVAIDGVWTQHESLANLPAAHAHGYQLEHFDFPCRELVILFPGENDMLFRYAMAC